MIALQHNALSRLALPALVLATLTGCQAQRAVVAPAEPTWTYRDGQTQLSNNDTWDQLIPATALIYQAPQVASVEEPTR